MKEIKKLKLNIFGKSYLISTDENEDEICAAAQELHALMEHISDKTKLQEGYKIAVLAALQLATKCNKMQKDFDLWLSHAKRLNNLLEDSA